MQPVALGVRYQHLVALLRVRLLLVLDQHRPVAVGVIRKIHDVVLPGSLVLHLIQDRFDPVHSILALRVTDHVSLGTPVDPRVPHTEPALLLQNLPVGDGPLVLPAPRRTRPQNRVGRMLLHRVKGLGQAIESANLQHIQEQHLPSRLRLQVRNHQLVKVDASRGAQDREGHSQDAAGSFAYTSLDGVDVAERRRPGGLLMGDGIPTDGATLVGGGEPETQPARVEAVASGRVGPEYPGHVVLVPDQDGVMVGFLAVMQRLDRPGLAVEEGILDLVLHLLPESRYPTCRHPPSNPPSPERRTTKAGRSWDSLPRP